MASKNVSQIVFGAGILALFVLIGFIWFKVWTLGEDASDYDTVCLEDGHEYWIANFAAKGFLGIKLDDEGKPILCQPTR